MQIYKSGLKPQLALLAAAGVARARWGVATGVQQVVGAALEVADGPRGGRVDQGLGQVGWAQATV